MKDCIVIIPTYNEKENIGNIIPYTLNLSDRLEILIIEDGSPDGTANIVKGLMPQFPGRIHIIERSGKPTSPALNGHSKTTISISLKWMPTFHILRKSY